jgi:nucleotide-binding universal stress UspA family protein
MFRTIIVPLDGSELAEQALPSARELARRSAATLRLLRVHVVPRGAMAYAREWDEEIRQRETAYLNEIAERVSEPIGVRPETLLVDGHPADAIREAADDAQAPLIVMSSHGRTGFSRFWIGSVTDAVIGRAKTPVLMIRSHEPRGEAAPTTIHAVIVPLDGSTLAEEILPHAAAVASAMDARLELLRVVEPSDAPPTPPALAEDALGAMVRQITDELRKTATRIAGSAPGLDVRARVLVAESPANGIIATARADGCELVAMTTRAAGLTRLVVGSVADKVIRAGPAMVLLLRPAAAATEAPVQT